MLNSSINGEITFWASNLPQFAGANSNYEGGKNFSRYVNIGLGPDRAFKISSTAVIDLMVDIFGYFAP